MDTNLERNREELKEVKKIVDLLDARLDSLEKEIVRFRVHLFYILLVLNAFVGPLASYFIKVLFP